MFGDTSRLLMSSALEHLQLEQSLSAIVTFSEQLDEMLGGGIPLCRVTEISGVPGIGKTQLWQVYTTKLQ